MPKSTIRVTVEFEDADGDVQVAILSPDAATALRDELTTILENKVEDQV